MMSTGARNWPVEMMSGTRLNDQYFFMEHAARATAEMKSASFAHGFLDAGVPEKRRLR